VAEGRSGTVMAAIGGVLVLVFSFCLLFSLIWLLLGGIFAVTFPIVFGLPVRDAQLDEIRLQGVRARNHGDQLSHAHLGWIGCRRRDFGLGKGAWQVRPDVEA